MDDDEDLWGDCYDENDGECLSDLGDASHASDDGSECSELQQGWGEECENWYDEQDPLFEAGEEPENAIEFPAPRALRNEPDTYATLVRVCDRPVDDEKIKYVVKRDDTAASLKLIFVKHYEMDVELYRDRECTDIIGDRELVHDQEIFLETRGFYSYEGEVTLDRLKGCSQHAMAVRSKILRLQDLIHATQYEQRHAQNYVYLPSKMKKTTRKKLKPVALGILENFRSMCVTGDKSASMSEIQAEFVQHFEFLLPASISRRFFDANDVCGRLIDGTLARSRWQKDERSEAEKGPIPHTGLMNKKNINDEDMNVFEPAERYVYYFLFQKEMNEIEKRIDRIERKIDILLENSGQVKSHITWIDRIAKMFMPGLTRLLSLPRIAKSSLT